MCKNFFSFIKAHTPFTISLLLFLIPQQSIAQEAPTHPSCLQKLLLNQALEGNQNPELNQAKLMNKAPRDWNFIVYIAANNNLHRFGIQNMQQMISVGSAYSINIIAQIDEYGKNEVSRFYIEKNNPIIASQHSDEPAAISGTPESLYNFVRWAIHTFPARRQAIVIWNHGSGIKDPSVWGKIISTHREELFSKNPTTGLMELNRQKLANKISDYCYKHYFSQKEKHRGIAFNDLAEEYLSNQELQAVLTRISQVDLKGEKIDLLCMDACHMAMIEIGSQIKDSVKYMVASQEVEPASGYNYTYLLEPFLRASPSSKEFAQHAVYAYQQEYINENADYTQSATDLTSFENIEINIRKTAQLLIQLINDEDEPDIIELLMYIRRNYELTTSFCDTDYIDFCHFYKSLAQIIMGEHSLKQYSFSANYKLFQLQETLLQGIGLMNRYIISNSSGINLPGAHGLSIYFPERAIHSSYYKTIFDRNTHWSLFLKRYIQESRKRAKKQCHKLDAKLKQRKKNEK